jgi:hypothetical protein
MGDPYETVNCSWCGREHRLAYSYKETGLPYCSSTCQEKAGASYATSAAKENAKAANVKAIRNARERYEEEKYQRIMAAAAAAQAREKKAAAAAADADAEAVKAAMARFYEAAKEDMLREKAGKQAKGGYSRKLRKNCK